MSSTPFVDDVERSRARTDITTDFYARALEASAARGAAWRPPCRRGHRSCPAARERPPASSPAAAGRRSSCPCRPFLYPPAQTSKKRGLAEIAKRKFRIQRNDGHEQKDCYIYDLGAEEPKEPAGTCYGEWGKDFFCGMPKIVKKK